MNRRNFLTHVACVAAASTAAIVPMAIAEPADPALGLALRWLEIELQFIACADDDDLIDTLGDRQAEIMGQLVQTRATTFAGLRAKARVMAVGAGIKDGADPMECRDNDTRMMASVIADIERMGALS